jgi:hypothetical protein
MHGGVRENGSHILIPHNRCMLRSSTLRVN